MAQQTINVGTVANDRTGDTWRNSMNKTNDNFDELYAIKHPTKRVVVNVLADFPAAVSGVITLADDTEYFLGDSVNVGITTFAWGSNTVISGLLQSVVTLTYTGTGDMFTITNTGGRIQGIEISCTSGRVFNFSDSTDSAFRVIDTIINAATLGLFNSTGTNGSIIRFTNLLSSTFTTNGFKFTGGHNGFFMDVTSVNPAAGILLDLGTATFQKFTVNNLITDIAAGATFLSGAAGSANINATGSGTVNENTISGAGTVLSGIAAGDSRWEFFQNNKIIDTRPDGLLYMQGNATNTVITTAGVYVIIAGTRTVGPTSQFTGTTAGRLTYNGVKDVRVPITVSVSVEPVSGTNKNISIRLAKNGTTIAGSQRTVRADSGSPISMTMPWQEDMSTNDYVEAFITNDTDTVNVLVSSSITRIA